MSDKVKFQTNMGDVVFELYWDHAPKRGYYNGVIFHRIIADFMAQTGDPTGTGRGGTSIYGQKFEDEISPELRFVGAGILAMANSGPNTNGSQFFITLAPTPYLDGKHTIFGRVAAGMNVVQRIGAVATDAQDSGLGPDSDSELSSAPPSPRLDPVPLLPPDPAPPSETEPRKARPRAKRQPSTTVPNPPSSPKRRKRAEAVKVNEATGKGKETAEKGKGKEVGATSRKGGAKAVGKTKVQVQAEDPSPEIPPLDEQPSTSTGPKSRKPKPTKVSPPAPAPPVKKPAPSKPKVATTSKTALPDQDEVPPPPAKKPAPFAKTKSNPEPSPPEDQSADPPKVDPPPAPITKPAPFAKPAPKPKPAPPTKPPPFNTSKSDPSRPAPSAIKSTLLSTRTKRPTFNESADSSDEEEETPKRHKRRKSHVEATSKPTRKSRPSLPAQPTPRAKSRLETTSSPVELRPASFLTKTSSLSFMMKPAAPSTSANLQPREDVWSYDDLTGLTWVKLDVHKCEIVPGNDQAGVSEQWCWWPAEVKQNTSNGLKLCLCGLGIERELGPHVAAETNVLAFRKPNISSVRFPTFKTAFSPRVGQAESGEPSAGEPSNQSTGERPGESSTPPAILPSSPSALETTWKQALTRAFEIDTESNDGLVDIHLLFSQKSQSSREEDELSGNTLEEQEQSEDEDEDLLDVGATVLCRFRTRYYPAQIISYHPRDGKARRRGPKGKYKCRFADDSTKLAVRREIMTTLDDGFVVCPLGTYQQYTSNTHQKPSGVREPSPAPRAHSPAPEPDDSKIDPEEYCSRERMRDQLKPVLPFLKGLIERSYIPGKGIVQGTEIPCEPRVSEDSPTKESELDTSPDNQDATTPSESILDRHAIFMQGGRARKNLAYSVHTGDLNEDDCEELMFEISRWALRGERWACGSSSQESGKGTASQDVGEAMEDVGDIKNQEGVDVLSQEGGEAIDRVEGRAVAQVAPGDESTVQENGEGNSMNGIIQEDGSTSQEIQMAEDPDTEIAADAKEPEHKEPADDSTPDTDVEMQDASQETNDQQDSPP
ncbi:unnamed protein product, partial [Rhizoctonia solani]